MFLNAQEGLISAKYLLPLTVAFLAIAAAALGFRASRRHGYGPATARSGSV